MSQFNHLRNLSEDSEELRLNSDIKAHFIDESIIQEETYVNSSLLIGEQELDCSRKIKPKPQNKVNVLKSKII